MWDVEFSAKAQKQFAKLDRQTQQSIVRYLDRILQEQDPFTFGKALVGELSGFWHYRVGKYRIICAIEEGRMVVTVITIAKRDKVYH